MDMLCLSSYMLYIFTVLHTNHHPPLNVSNINAIVGKEEKDEDKDI